MDFEQLKKDGKTVIYKETKENEQPSGWEFWSEANLPDKHLYVWRKIVTFEEAKQYEFERGLI